MKKTLITLAAALAAASVAQAIEISDVSKVTPTINETELPVQDAWPQRFHAGNYDANDRSFTLTVVMDWTKLLADLTTDTAGEEVYGVANTDNYYGWDYCNNGVKMYKDSDGDLHVALFVDHHGTSSGYTSTFMTLDADTYTFGNKIALTYSYDGAGEYTLSALTKTNSLTSVSGSTTLDDAWQLRNSCVYFRTENDPTVSAEVRATQLDPSAVSAVVMYAGVLKESDIIAVSQKAIPEPATATLSLLALAGLAARRRRK